MISQMVLVALTIFNVLILGLVFMTYVMMLNTKYQINQIHAAMTTIVTKLLGMEQVLGKVVNALSDLTEVNSEVFDQISMNFGEGAIGNVYRTMDGKYSSNTLEGLIDKIKKDGKEKNYLTEDMDQLRELFESEDDIFGEDED
jgi:phage-related protein